MDETKLNATELYQCINPGLIDYKLSVYDLEYTKEKRVVMVYWRCVGKIRCEGKEFSSERSSIYTTNKVNPETYIEFDDLTEQDCLGWIMDVGHNEIRKMQSDICKSIKQQLRPHTTLTGVPWEK